MFELRDLRRRGAGIGPMLDRYRENRRQLIQRKYFGIARSGSMQRKLRLRDVPRGSGETVAVDYPGNLGRRVGSSQRSGEHGRIFPANEALGLGGVGR